MSITATQITRIVDNSAAPVSDYQARPRTTLSIDGWVSGQLWMGGAGGYPMRASFQRVKNGPDIRPSFSRSWPDGTYHQPNQCDSIADAVAQLLRDCGDFQDARLTADTQICVKRVLWRNGEQISRTRQYDASSLASIARLVDEQSFSADFQQWEE